MEKIINGLNNKDNPFNLDNKYYDELIKMKIIESKKKEIKKEERESIIIGGHEISKNILTKRRGNIYGIVKEKEKEEEN